MFPYSHPLAILFAILFLSICRIDVIAEEITDGDEVVRLAHRIGDKYQANLGKIMTWRGTVEETYDITTFEGAFDAQGKGGTTVHEKKKTFFISDIVASNYFTKSENLDYASIFPDGTKKLLVKRSEAAFVKNKVYHYFPTYQRPPGDNGDPFYRKIHIGQNFGTSELFHTLFLPSYRSMPEPYFLPDTYKRFFYNSKFGRNRPDGQGKVFREGDVVTFVDPPFQNPHQISEHTQTVTDLAKGGALIEFHCSLESPGIRQDNHWHCEMQEINGIWVPSYTEWTRNDVAPFKRIIKWKVRWKEQELNTPIKDDEMTLLTLGARQTDLVEDYRNGALYNIKGDEYPPSLEEQFLIDTLEAGAKQDAWMRYGGTIMFVIGALFVLTAFVLYYIERRRNKKDNNEKK